MEKLEVTMFQAGSGDSFLISICHNNKEINILVDCGEYNTYYTSIKPKLVDMKNNRKRIDYLILTHMHDDHIGGALELFKENGTYEESKIINIENVIYNGINTLKLEEYNEIALNEEDKVIYRSIVNKGLSVLKGTDNSHSISIKQELFLSSYLQKGGYKWNSLKEFKQGIVSADLLPEIKIDNEIVLTFLSPNIENLKELNKSWIKYLKTYRKKIQICNDELAMTAYEAFMTLISHDDSVDLIGQISRNSKKLTENEIIELSKCNIMQDTKKVENGSSIAFLLKVKDKKLLFLGDSFSDVYYENLLKLTQKESITWFNFIKVSHHGSKFNTYDKFLKRFDASKYCISTNGTYGHPDIETISKIINRKITIKDKNVRKIIINNWTDSINRFNNKELEDNFKYEIQYINNESIEID